MPTSTQSLIDLETRFWQSMVDNDADAAVAMLAEPALMVSAHGAMQFDHAGYRKMADNGPMVVKSFELSDVKVLFPSETTAILTYRVRQGVGSRGKDDSTTQEMNDTSTWIQSGGTWLCAIHTETPAAPAPARAAN